MSSLLKMLRKHFIQTLTWMVICWSLMKHARSQPFYYDEERAYFHDTGSSTSEMFNLDPVEHNQDGSMRALAGLTTDKEATTISYYDEIHNSATDLTSLDSSEQDHFETTTATIHEPTTTDVDEDIININQENGDSSNRESEAKKRTKINSAFSQFKETKSAVLNVVSNSPITRHSNQPKKLANQEDRSLASDHINDFSGYSLQVSEPGLSNGLSPIPFKSNDISQRRNATSAFDHEIKQKNQTMLEFLSNNSGLCEPRTHNGCDVTHYERCDSDTRQCRCLNGFFPENAALGTGHCKAVSFYHGHLKVTSLQNNQRFSNEQIESIKQKLIVLIGFSLKRWGIDAVLDLHIRSVEIKDHHTTLTFEVGLNKDVLSRDEDVHILLSRDVIVTAQGELLVEASEEFVRGGNASRGVSSPLVELNPCINSEHNHCSQHASCNYLDGTVACQCAQGYEDLTPNHYRLPGEVCIEKCECQNGGICVDIEGSSDTRQCSCLKWYIGSQCQIDGKELMLICCCSIGSVVLLTLLMCCGYYGCIKHKDNAARSSMFSLTPDINILKLPRVWMDTSGYNDHDLSPDNQRRISVTSERNPYFDGYIMEDVSLGTLQREKDIHSSCYQVSQTSLGHCPATMSSHSFYRY